MGLVESEELNSPGEQWVSLPELFFQNLNTTIFSENWRLVFNLPADASFDLLIDKCLKIGLLLLHCHGIHAVRSMIRLEFLYP